MICIVRYLGTYCLFGPFSLTPNLLTQMLLDSDTFLLFMYDNLILF